MISSLQDLEHAAQEAGLTEEQTSDLIHAMRYDFSWIKVPEDLDLPDDPVEPLKSYTTPHTGSQWESLGLCHNSVLAYISDMISQIQDLQGHAESLESERGDLEWQLDEAQSRNALLEQDIEDLKNDIDQLSMEA